MKSALIKSKRAASPLTKFKTRENIDEVYINYYDDETLFTKRAETQKWQSTSESLEQESEIFNNTLSLTKGAKDDLKLHLEEIDESIVRIIENQDEFLENDEIDYGNEIIMHETFNSDNKIFTDNDNLNDIEICASAFDEIILYIEDSAISQCLTNIKNVLLEKANKKSYLEEAEARANVMLDEKLELQIKNYEELEEEMNDLNAEYKKMHGEFTALEENYNIAREEEFKYEGECSLLEQENQQLKRANVELQYEMTKKVSERDELFERAKRLTKVIQKLKLSEEAQQEILSHFDEQIKGLKGERDELLYECEENKDEIEKFIEENDELEKKLIAQKEEFELEADKLKERLEMGGNLNGIKMKDADNIYLLSECIKDGIMALVTLSDEEREDELNEIFGITREELFNLKHLLTHLQNFDVESGVVEFFENDYLDEYITSLSEEVQVTIAAEKEKIVYKYVEPNKKGESNIYSENESAMDFEGQSKDEEAHKGYNCYSEVGVTEELESALLKYRSGVMSKLQYAKVVITYNTIDSFPNYHGSLQTNIHEFAEESNEEAKNSGGKSTNESPFGIAKPIDYEEPDYSLAQQENAFRQSQLSVDSLNEQTKTEYDISMMLLEQLKKFEYNINRSVSYLETEEIESEDLVTIVQNDLFTREESNHEYDKLTNDVINDVKHIVFNNDQMDNEKEQVIDLLKKKSDQISTILNITPEVLYTAIVQINEEKQKLSRRSSEFQEIESPKQLRIPRNSGIEINSSDRNTSLSLSDGIVDLEEILDFAETLESMQSSIQEDGAFDKADKNFQADIRISGVRMAQSLWNKNKERMENQICEEEKQLIELTDNIQCLKKENQMLKDLLAENKKQHLFNESGGSGTTHLDMAIPNIEYLYVDELVKDDLDSDRIVECNELLTEQSDKEKNNAIFLDKDLLARPVLRNNSADFLVANVDMNHKIEIQPSSSIIERQRKITSRGEISRKTGARPMSTMSDYSSIEETDDQDDAERNNTKSILHSEQNILLSKSKVINNLDNTEANASDFLTKESQENQLLNSELSNQTIDMQVYQKECADGYTETNQSSKDNEIECLQEMMSAANGDSIVEQQHYYENVGIEVEEEIDISTILDILNRSVQVQTDYSGFDSEEIETEEGADSGIEDKIIYKDMEEIINDSINGKNIVDEAVFDNFTLINSNVDEEKRSNLIAECEEYNLNSKLVSNVDELIINKEEADEQNTNKSSYAITLSRSDPKRIPLDITEGRKNQQADEKTLSCDELEIREVIEQDLKKACLKLHPYRGNFLTCLTKELLEQPIVEQFILEHPFDRIYYRFYPMSENIKEAVFAPAVIRSIEQKEFNNNIRESQTRDFFVTIITCLEKKQYLPVDIAEQEYEEYSLALLPEPLQKVKYLRLSACSILGQKPEIFEDLLVFQDIHYCDFENNEYIEIPMNQVVIKPLKWILNAIRTIISDRNKASITEVCFNVNSTQINVEQAKFDIMSGELDASEALSISKFVIYWSKERYGIRSIMLSAVWNIIANLVYHEYDDEEVYLFTRMFFDDLPQDYEELYLSIVQELPPQPILTKNIHEIVNKLIPSFSQKRIESLYSSIMAIQYGKTESSTVSPYVEYYTFISLLLCSYGNHRKSEFEGLVQIMKFFNRDMDQKTFREFLCTLKVDILNYTISEVFYEYSNSGIIKFPEIEKFFCEFELARFCNIQTKTLKEVVSNDIEKMANQCSAIYEKMQVSMFKIERYMTRLEQEKLKSSFEILQNDILAYDISSCVNEFEVIIELGIECLGNRAPDACLAVIIGTSSALSQVVVNIE